MALMAKLAKPHVQPQPSDPLRTAATSMDIQSATARDIGRQERCGGVLVKLIGAASGLSGLHAVQRRRRAPTAQTSRHREVLSRPLEEARPRVKEAQATGCSQVNVNPSGGRGAGLELTQDSS